MPRWITPGWIALLVMSAIAMISVTPYDYEWTYWLYQNRWDDFAEFMRRTFFEGGLWGGTDIAIVLQLLVAGAYLSLHFSKKPFWQSIQGWRPHAGFVVACSLVTSLGIIHSLKWVMGRARPHPVFKDKLPFSEWYEFGPHFVADGIFFGSFPSGHTAAVFLLMTGGYLIWGARTATWKSRLLAISWSSMVLGYTGLMIIARAMSRHHWVSDSIATVCLGWLLMHLLYYHGLNVPKQLEYWQKHSSFEGLPRCWELRFCGHLLGITLGLMGIAIGGRSLWLQNAPWLGVLVFLGIWMVLRFGKRCCAFHQEIRSHWEDT